MTDTATPAAPTPEVVTTPVVAPASPAAVTPPIVEQPVAAPAAPAPEAIGATPPVEDTATGAFAYRETGDPGLDVALAFIGNMGLGPDDAAVKAAVDGDFTKLEATLFAMGTKATGYERYVALAKASYETNATATSAKQTAITAAVTEAAGSAEQWAAIKAWAGANATPEEKAEINTMLSGGPTQARAAAQHLAGLYRNAGGTVVKPAAALVVNAGAAPTGNGALSPSDYFEAVRELRTTLGARDLDKSPQYKALQARRSAWRG